MRFGIGFTLSTICFFFDTMPIIMVAVSEYVEAAIRRLPFCDIFIHFLKQKMLYIDLDFNEFFPSIQITIFQHWFR